MFNRPLRIIYLRSSACIHSAYLYLLKKSNQWLSNELYYVEMKLR